MIFSWLVRGGNPFRCHPFPSCCRLLQVLGNSNSPMKPDSSATSLANRSSRQKATYRRMCRKTYLALRTFCILHFSF